MSKPRIADLFCGAGGAARGLQQAGFHVTGYDIVHQPRYAGDEFVQADALEVDLSGFDAVWASPPCQWVTFAAIQWRKNGREYPQLVEPTRNLLMASGIPYIIEQPVGRPLVNPVLLNGATFGLHVKRDRYFETSFAMPLVLLNGEERPAHFGRPFDARRGELFYPVGHFSGVEAAREAMGVPWMTRDEVSQAIPPAYSKFLGEQLLKAL
jgi:DNA (cytosine-5)-methyltransferase 1